MATATALHQDQVTNDAESRFETPYRVEITIEGTTDFLFHRWSTEEVESKAAAAKGSKAKKTDNVESYVYRAKDGCVGIPGEYLRQSIIGAAKFIQDPRSPRKSAVDLFKASVVNLTDVASLGATDWDYLDRRRVMVQRNGVTRTRPAMESGWRGAFIFIILAPEYINPQMLNSAVVQAGRLVGVGDFRPTFGRFNVVKFEVLKD